MTGRALTVIHVHHPTQIEVRYVTDDHSGNQWTNLTFGEAQVTIYGDHAKTAAMLMAAAGQCPKPNCITYVDSDGSRCAHPTGHGGEHETYEQVRARTLAEDRGVTA